MKPTMITYLQDNLSSFRKSERILAEWILSNTVKTPKLTIKSLSTLSGVSEPSIVRFCRRVGTKGYADFKLRLTENLASGRFNSSISLDDAYSTQTLKTSIIDIQKNALTELNDELSDEAIEYALYHLSQANRIFILGAGNCQNAAEEAYELLWPLKNGAFLCRDSQTALNHVLQASQGDLLWILGDPIETEKLLISAHTQGMKTLGFCHVEAPQTEQFDAIIPISIKSSTRHIESLCKLTKMRAMVQVLLQTFRFDLQGKLDKRLKQSKKQQAKQSTIPQQSSLW